jgi:3-deoxy-D-manno-octulosonic-acid transferase
MLAVAPVLDAMRRDGHEVYLTTTTSTGWRVADDRFHGVTVGMGYFPLDWWPFVRRAWKKIQPDIVIVMEGERWPELIRYANARRTPVLCVNARMSDRSFARMKRWPGGARLMLDGLTRVLPGSAQDAARFRELGVPAEKITTTGNIKLDVPIPPLTEAERAQLRRELGLGAGLVLLGASTWPGETEPLVEALRAARAAGLGCSLLLVPRHVERRHDIEQALRASGLTFHFRSKGAAAREVDVAVGDTTGELKKLTQIADLVFVGKSLPPHTDGQTPVEAAVLGKPIVMGPGMGNFRQIADELTAAGAARRVGTAELPATARELLADPARRGAMAAAATEWHRANVGAVARTLAVVREELARR